MRKGRRRSAHGSRPAKPPEILVLSASRAREYEPTGREVCISIGDPNTPDVPLSDKFVDVLRLAFNDIAGPSPLRSDCLFAPEHARAIVDFVDRLGDLDRIIIHCVAGLSRSPGVALGLSDLHGWPTTALEKQFPTFNTWVRRELARILPRRRAREPKDGSRT